MALAKSLNAEQLEDVAEILGIGRAQEEAKWPDPIPFDDYSLLPDFPLDVLPDVGRRMVAIVSEVAQVDSGLPGVLYLAALSACLGGRVSVDLSSHTEQCCLYVAAILPSGHRKTFVDDEISRPLHDYQYERQQEMRDCIRDASNRQKVLESRLAKLQQQAANTEDAIKRHELIALAADVAKQIQDNPVPAPPVYICDDITTEKLGLLMAANGERMAILSAEGGIFKLINGLYNERDGNFDLYLKAHAGDPWSSHRVGRESTSMRKPVLTMGLAIQPDVLDEIGRNKHFRGRGLLARFLYSICKSKIGYRIRQNKALPESTLQEYKNHIYSLMDVPSNVKIVLTPEAQKRWDEFYNDIERDLRPGGALEYLPDWGSKLPGAVARIAGQLHMAALGQTGIEKPVSVDFVTASCVLGGYFREHAMAAFHQMLEDPRIAAAKKILFYIEKYKPDSFKGRDILRHAYFANRTMDEIEPGLKILLERGFLRERPSSYAGKGRPEATVYEVNPKLFKNNVREIR
jgi:replicative DNA helicase